MAGLPKKVTVVESASLASSDAELIQVLIKTLGDIEPVTRSLIEGEIPSRRRRL
jgi:hypothetical protein